MHLRVLRVFQEWGDALGQGRRELVKLAKIELFHFAGPTSVIGDLKVLEIFDTHVFIADLLLIHTQVGFN